MLSRSRVRTDRAVCLEHMIARIDGERQLCTHAAAVGLRHEEHDRIVAGVGLQDVQQARRRKRVQLV